MHWKSRIKARLSHLTRRSAAPGPPPDLCLHSPAAGAHWHCVERRRVGWRCADSLWHPCDVLLERRTEQGWTPVALLAARVDPRAHGASVLVPELPAGPYRVRVTSPELAAAACSAPVRISRS
ncbi:hypothetical protein C6N75_20290 [Streptomyces solincola]|uniref:Uncharacterized protein n=1 Tax=Streptomyces solincola TaxID=2100817 RepID=A0A2S9PSP4_9ACTN|nr:hypothetical protein [Streptomyces solincola]PRH77435.1 hypothetical protein C6N75_20290 [Streptomyces solincola]